MQYIFIQHPLVYSFSVWVMSRKVFLFISALPEDEFFSSKHVGEITAT